MVPFFYIVGICISRNMKNPRIGLRYSTFRDKLDLHCHGCSEDPTPKIVQEVENAIERSRESSIAEAALAQNSGHGGGPVPLHPIAFLPRKGPVNPADLNTSFKVDEDISERSNVDIAAC